MDIQIIPYKLEGEVMAPSSKSAAHRALICACLARGTSKIYNIGNNDDIIATINAATALGATCTRIDDNNIEVTGITTAPTHATIDCNESGSTFRFFVPIVAALGVTTTFLGHGELPNRPMTVLTSIMEEHGIEFFHSGKEHEIFTVKGKLHAGDYRLPGNISSQYITGLLFALPLLREESEIILTTSLESSAYVDLTIDILSDFNVTIPVIDNRYCISENSTVKECNFTVEGDYSGAAFWLCASAIGSKINVKGLLIDSLQGDRQIISLLEQFGCEMQSDNGVLVKAAPLSAITIDATEVPDLVPILAVVATQAEGTTTIINAGRLRIKECDRLIATTQGLSLLGANIKELPEGLEIKGKQVLHGGTVSSFDDHRIAMAMSIAATVATEPVTVTGAECVRKSYPAFYDHFRELGGIAHVL